jgi:hypothetical protein
LWRGYLLSLWSPFQGAAVFAVRIGAAGGLVAVIFVVFLLSATLLLSPLQLGHLLAEVLELAVPLLPPYDG